MNERNAVGENRSKSLKAYSCQCTGSKNVKDARRNCESLGNSE